MARTTTTTTKPSAKKATTAPPPREFIDAALMKRAMNLRKEGKTMNQIGADLGVKATAYLAKKIRENYGADALAKPAAQGTGRAKRAKRATVAAKGPSAAKTPKRRATRKPAAAKEA
jgi:hypothetical protein